MGINGNTFAPGADGFNLADVESPSELPFVPAGDKALVYMGGSITARPLSSPPSRRTSAIHRSTASTSRIQAAARLQRPN
jgi:hypothetical protein